MVRFFVVFMLTLSFSLNAQHMTLDKAFAIFDGSGKEITSKEVLDAAANADVFFFGELHNNPIAHWLQFEFTQALHQYKDGKIMLGAEMFESDNQILINEYFEGIISQKNFEEEARLWNNYSTDYKPILEFAKTNQLSLIATNIPRRYASIVFKGGFEALNQVSDQGKKYIAPMPIPYDAELPGYKKMLDMMGGHGGDGADNFPKAQAIKDATMGHFITSNFKPDHTFIHLNGSYHSDNKEGIVWYIQQYKPELKVVTLTTVESDNLAELPEEAKNKADFVIVVKASMTKTY